MNKQNMRDQFTITVLICAYNAADTLQSQLSALEPQVNTLDAELLVVDNRSTDNTKEIALDFTARIPSLRVIDAPDSQGKSYATNVGVANARSPLIAITDADDVVDDQWLASHLAGLSLERLTTGPINTTKLNPHRAWTPQPKWGQEPQLGFLPFMSGSNQGFSRELFETVGGMDEKMRIGEDIAFSWRMQLGGAKIFFTENAVVNIRYRNNSRDDWLQTLSFAKAHCHLFRLFHQHGMPRSSRKDVVNRYRNIARGLIHYRSQPDDKRYQIKRNIIIALGHLIGSLQYRVFYL